MKTTGIIGLGDMGSGLAKNLINNNYSCVGFDLDPQRVSNFEALGGIASRSAMDVAKASDAVFVMVMNGAQARQAIFGDAGLLAHLRPGSAIILTATIKPSEARAIADDMAGSGIHLIDSPVSGGYSGAQDGTLTLMAAAPTDVLEEFAPVLQAVSRTVHCVGTKGGDGQTVKACLQSLIGSIFSATFEASVLAAKAGVPGEVLYDVFSTSGAGCGVANTALGHIIDREFEGTGSHINTMHKDLTIALNLGEELGVPLHSAASAMQIFHAGRAKYPDGDNWACAQVIEDIVGAQLHREGAQS